MPPSSKGKSRDKVAKATGKKARTLAKAEAVVAAAESDPEKFGNLVRDMDESGNVDRAFKQVNIAQARAAYEARSDRGANIGDLVDMAEAGQKFAADLRRPTLGIQGLLRQGKAAQRRALL